MPSISVPTAILGAAVVGGGTSLLAGQATAGAAKDTAAANNQLTRDIYNENKAILSPYASTGAQANQAQADLVLGNGAGGSGGGAGAPAGWDAQAFLTLHPELQSGYEANKASNPAYTESLPDYALRQHLEHPDVWGYTPPAGIGVGAAPSGESPTLANFAEKVGTAPEIKAISDAIGPDYQSYLDKSGAGKTIDQLDRGVGGSVQDFTANSGVATSEKANDQLLGLDGGGYDAYKKNIGVDVTDKANADLLGLGEAGGGYGAYQTNAGIKPANDAIESFLGIGAGGLSDFLNSNGYNFVLDSGAKAIERSKAAKGLLTSGSTGKALTDYGQNAAKSYGAAYLGALGNYSGLREGQAQSYQGDVSGLGAAREGRGVNYSNLLAARSGRNETINNDYLSKVAGVGQIKTSTLADFAGLQSGLSDMNRNNFSSYWSATGDLANRGAAAGSALAGVGTNFAATTSANNNSALAARAAANASTAGSINSLLGNAVGAYSYGKGYGGGWGGSAPPTTYDYGNASGVPY